MPLIENAEVIEKKLAVGDVILVNEIGFKLSSSLCIKLGNFLKNGYQERGWTHSAIYIGDGKMIESLAAPIGVVERGFRESYLMGTHNFLILRHKNATQEKLKRAVEYCVSEKGKKYDTRAIVYFLALNIFPRQLHFLFKIFSWSDKFNEKDKFFCSELVSRAFEEAGVYCFEEKSFKIMPADFNNPLLFELIHRHKVFKGNKVWRFIKDAIFCTMYFFVAFGIYSLMVWLIFNIKQALIFLAAVLAAAAWALVQTVMKKQAIEESTANKP